MISSTEGEIMPTNDKYFPTVVEPNSDIVKLYWSILRNDPNYKKDYEELQKDYNELQEDYDGKEMWFSDKWSLLEPIDPKQDEVEPLYFFRDNQPFTPVKSKGLSTSPYAPYELTIELDIRRDQETLIEEIKKIISNEKENALDGKEAINLIGEERSSDSEEKKKYYEDLLYVHELRVADLKYNEILDMSDYEGKGFEYHTVDNYCKRIRTIKKNFTVPIVKE
jgi:hypothetical protein